MRDLGGHALQHAILRIPIPPGVGPWRHPVRWHRGPRAGAHPARTGGQCVCAAGGRSRTRHAARSAGPPRRAESAGRCPAPRRAEQHPICALCARPACRPARALGGGVERGRAHGQPPHHRRRPRLDLRGALRQRPGRAWLRACPHRPGAHARQRRHRRHHPRVERHGQRLQPAGEAGGGHPAHQRGDPALRGHGGQLGRGLRTEHARRLSHGRQAVEQCAALPAQGASLHCPQRHRGGALVGGGRSGPGAPARGAFRQGPRLPDLGRCPRGPVGRGARASAAAPHLGGLPPGAAPIRRGPPEGHGAGGAQRLALQERGPGPHRPLHGGA